LAFIPQFIDPTYSVASQFVVLGLLSVALNTAVDVVVAYWAAKAKEGLATRPTTIIRLRQASATVLCGLGTGLLLARRAGCHFT
jgi:threonine/homoserine/homoserine lactone efflux protein